jgi:HlyD family secretion protein
MATLTLPRKRGIKFNKWLILGAAVVVVGIAAAYFVANTLAADTSARTVTTVAVSRGTITQTVSGSGTVTADRTIDLGFDVTGTVREVLVQAGDTVVEGQTLALLDSRDLDAALASANAGLASARATLTQKQTGSATAQEIASARAAVESATKAYEDLAAGPSPAELASAQAAVAGAQAAYTAAQTESEVGSSTLRSLKATLEQARIALQSAQAAYDRIAWRSDVGASSEAAELQDATISYEKALADYNAQLVTNGPDAESAIATARANLLSAQTNLADLTPTEADIASAKASLESAKATLAGLTSAASDTEVAIAQAGVDSAEQAVKQAQVNLEQAALRAPFGGVISDVAMVPGSSAGDAAMTVIDQDPLHVELTLSENDVVKAEVGQMVKLTSDALSDWNAVGTVRYVGPNGTESNGVVTYLVRVDLPGGNSRIRVGMTLNVDIVTAERQNVLIVPNAAILPQGDGYIVQVIGADGMTQNQPIETGISDGTQTEITSGVVEGQKVISLPISTTSSNTSSSNGGGGPPGGGFFGPP